MLCVAAPSPCTSPRLRRRTRSGRKILLPSPALFNPERRHFVEPEDVCLSLRDVYESMETEQRLSSREQRRRVIACAQKRAATCGSSSQSIPCEDLLSMPAYSRPTTAFSLASTLGVPNKPQSLILPDGQATHYDEDGEEDGGSTSHQHILHNRSVTSLSAPPQPAWTTRSKICARSRSAVEREMEGMVNSLSRQCCDVLGPRTCHQCAMIQRREHDTRRQESTNIVFPNLYISEENFSTALLVSKACPHLNAYQIQTKLVCGEIMRPGIRQHLEKRSREMRTASGSGSETESPREEKENGKTLIKAFAQKPLTSPHYFSNIQDLNSKLIAGKRAVSLKMALSKEIALNRERKRSSDRVLSFSELINPAFISPKRIPKEKEPDYRAFYQPPLLPKVCQNVEPAFFAGSDADYQLPDRLPQHVSPDDDSRPETAMTSASSNPDE